MMNWIKSHGSAVLLNHVFLFTLCFKNFIQYYFQLILLIPIEKKWIHFCESLVSDGGDCIIDGGGGNGIGFIISSILNFGITFLSCC